MSDPEPTLQLLVRERNGVSAFNIEGTDFVDTGFSDQGVDSIAYDGLGTSFVSYNRKEGATVYDAETRTPLFESDVKKVMGAALSRKGTYLALWQVPDLEGKRENLYIYKVRSQERVGSLWAPHWPCIDWFADESCAVFYHLLTGISFYEDFAKPPTANVPGRWNVVSLSPTSPATIFAAMIPGEKERETVPTKIRVFRYPKVVKDILTHELRVDSASVSWNKKGTSCLVQAGLDADASGRSYYGEAALFLFNVQDKKITPIPTGDTPIHDVKWNGNGKEFIVVYGKMPANEAKLIDEKGVLIHKFDVSPKNTVHWSPHNRYFMLAGFGNLPGDMVMYDREHLGKGTQVIGRCSQSSVTLCLFSPCSKYFLCATCHPRMTTANKITLFKVNGEKVGEKPYQELYEAAWRPFTVKAFSQGAPLAAAPAPKAAAKPAAKTAVFRAQGRNPGHADAIKASLSVPKVMSFFCVFFLGLKENEATSQIKIPKNINHRKRTTARAAKLPTASPPGGMRMRSRRHHRRRLRPRLWVCCLPPPSSSFLLPIATLRGSDNPLEIGFIVHC